MPLTKIKLPKKTNTQTNSYTGASGEVTIDTDKQVIVVHDGSTAGGISLASEARVNAAFTAANNSTDTWVRNAANAASSYANSGFSQANTATTNAATADQRAVTSGSYANSAYLTANSAGSYANAAFAAANSSTTVDGIDAVGFRNIPINSQNTAYTTVLADSGKVIFHPSTDANTRTFTIPANSTVAYPNGTAITFINMSASNVTIAITDDTMYSSPDGTTGLPMKLTQYGSATALKMTPTSWLISGSGLSAVVITQGAIFGYGLNVSDTNLSITNLVSTTGVVATNTTGVGTARKNLGAAGYGIDKAIFGYSTGGNVSMTNLVSNTGVVSADVTGVGTAREQPSAAGYGTDKAIFGYGAFVSMTNLVSNTGVVASDTTGVGTARGKSAAAGYGTDKAIFGYGQLGPGTYAPTSITNLVSNTGVVSTDTAGVGTARQGPAAAGYGTDKAIFGYGYDGTSALSITNLVSNTGVVASNTTGVGTVRYYSAGAGYGTDKAIFAYGTTSGGTAEVTSLSNLISNTGVVANDVAGVGTARYGLAAASFG